MLARYRAPIVILCASCGGATLWLGLVLSACASPMNSAGPSGESSASSVATGEGTDGRASTTHPSPSGSTVAGPGGTTVAGVATGLEVVGGSGTGDGCAGLTPGPLGAVESFALSPGACAPSLGGLQDCAPPSGDGNGHFATQVEDPSCDSKTLVIFGASGQLSARSTFDGFWWTAQPGGFQVFSDMGGPWLDLLGDDGGDQAVRFGRVQGLAEDPNGGSVAFTVALPDGGVSQYLVSIDAAGRQRWSLPVAESFSNGVIGVDTGGNTLLLLAGTFAGPWEGRWIDPTGLPSAPFAAGPGAPAASDPRLFPRIGGGLFLYEGANWVAAFMPASGAASAPPAWLAARPNTFLHLVRGDQAYALFPAPSWTAGSCPQWVEVVAPDGISCGVVQLPPGGGPLPSNPFIPSSPGAPCDLEVALDGTLIQRLPILTDCDDAGGACGCAWQFWPEYLR